MTAPRPHGRVKYVVECCRCDTCRADNRVYVRWLNRQHAYGRPRYVDAEPARTHVRALMAAGLGWQRVAKLAGVPNGSVSKLLYGDQTRGMASSQLVRPVTERKLLAVTADPANVAAHRRVPALGAHRRLRALVAVGYSQSRLAAELSVGRENFGAVMRSEEVHAATDRAVGRLYERLWNTPPPQTTPFEMAAVTRARRYAAERGWPPPMAWDDESLDDPDGMPQTGGPPTGRANRRVEPDEVRWLESFGTSRELVAGRLGVTPAAVERAMHREEAA
jgi:predicted transcriptional regulator